MSTKVERDTTLETVVKTFCNRCRVDINHKVLSSINESSHDSESGVSGWNDFETIECLGCNEISFRHHGYFSEYADHENSGTYEYLFPPSQKHHKKPSEFTYLPFSLDLIYEEAVRCFNTGLYILCAVAVRSIAEGICSDKGVKKGNIVVDTKGGPVQKSSSHLDGKINGLQEIGLITTDQRDALHQLRFLGNEAIHELERPTRSELLIALGIIEHMLTDLYEIPATTKKLVKNRERKKG